MAAWALTPPLAGALAFTGVGVASASSPKPSVSQHIKDFNHPNFKGGVHFQKERQARYSDRHVVSRHNQQIRQGNRVVVVVVIVYIQWDNDNNCWVRSQRQVDTHGHYLGNEVAA
jgi:hypothetical protein